MADKKKRQWRTRSPVLQEDVSPNLIPMIDIMFLLLLFLMLGADMGQREFEDVLLPIVHPTAVKEDKEQDKMGTTTINVYHKFEGRCTNYRDGGICTDRGHWSIGVRGNDYTPASIGTLIKEEAKLGQDPKNPAGASERRVMIRADQAALYEYVQKVIEACALAGIYKIELGAAAKT